MRTELVFGPPGTGKTTYLLREVQKEFERGVPPENVAFLAFTRQAANEARTRAAKLFDYDTERFRYFRTLHSLAFHQLKLTREDVMQTKHFKELGEICGVTFTGSYNEELERLPVGGSKGDRCMAIHALSRAKQTSIFDCWADYGGVELWEAERFSERLEQYKQQRTLLDFSDFMDDAVEELDAEVVVIDEAQDLTPQQWAYARRTAKHARRVIIAGDDDQAIFAWAGSSAGFLQRLEGQRTVLPKSHRLPQAPWALAESISAKIRSRVGKIWTHRGQLGLVVGLTEMDQAPLEKGTWLLLCRHQYQLSRLEGLVRRKGFVYQHKGRWSYEEPEVQAVLAYERCRRGEELSYSEARLVCSFVIGMVPPKEDKKYRYSDLPWPQPGQDWMLALTRLRVDEREYLRSVLRSGESLKEPGRIRIMTIHASKGAEADNVLLLPEMTRKAYLNREEDDELRVWYVGVSRCREALYISQAMGRESCALL